MMKQNVFDRSYKYNMQKPWGISDKYMKGSYWSKISKIKNAYFK